MAAPNTATSNGLDAMNMLEANDIKYEIQHADASNLFQEWIQ